MASFPDVVIFPGDVRYLPVADSDEVGSFYEVLGDLESPHWGKQVRSAAPAPAVNRTGPIDNSYNGMTRSRFTAPWQWFWVDLLSLAKYGKLFADLTREQKSYIIGKFKGLTTSNAYLNNTAGTDKYNCHPCGGTEAKRGSDPLIDPLICAKDKVQVIEIRTNSHGKKMGRLNGFDYRSAPPKPDLKDPRVMYATWIKADGTIQNFDRLGGIPVPYPYIQNGPCWYPMAELEAV